MIKGSKGATKAEKVSWTAWAATIIRTFPVWNLFIWGFEITAARVVIGWLLGGVRHQDQEDLLG